MLSRAAHSGALHDDGAINIRLADPEAAAAVTGSKMRGKSLETLLTFGVALLSSLLHCTFTTGQHHFLRMNDEKRYREGGRKRGREGKGRPFIT